MTRMTVKDLSPYVQAVIRDGLSINSQAKAAKVDPTELRRLIIADPAYAEALAAGKIRQRPTYTQEELRESEHVKAVMAGQNIASVANTFGMSEGTIRNHVKKAYPGGLKGQKNNPDDEVQGAAEGAHSNVSPGPNQIRMLPLISWIRAGKGDVANDYLQPGDAEGWYASPKAMSASSYVLRVRGDSMTAPSGAKRSYPEGSLIYVDPEKRAPNNGDRIIAKLDGTDEVTFKVYKNEDGRQWLMPLNPQHEPIREEFKVLGTVIGMWVD